VDTASSGFISGAPDRVRQREKDNGGATAPNHQEVINQNSDNGSFHAQRPKLNAAFAPPL
jgi:hypothetical protein